MTTEQTQATAQIDVPPEVEEVVRKAALAVVAKWIGKAFRWLSRR
jgi:hypothetical protein